MPTTTRDWAAEADAATSRALRMTRDLGERETARQIAVDILREVKGFDGDKLERANTLLHSRLLKEMCDYKDRLTKAVESVLVAAMKGL